MNSFFVNSWPLKEWKYFCLFIIVLIFTVEKLNSSSSNTSFVFKNDRYSIGLRTNVLSMRHLVWSFVITSSLHMK